MNDVLKKLCEIIEEQRKGHEDEPIFMIGEQLKEIAERESACAEILERDLLVDGMGLEGAAKALKKYADKHSNKRGCFCISPKVAEKILREFDGLPEPSKKLEQTAAPGYIDLSAFL